MSDTPDVKPAPAQCKALTKSGDRCRNRASEGLDYCHMHKSAAQVDAVVADTRADFAAVSEAAADELNAYASEIKQKSGYQAPPFSPSALAEMLKSNASKLAACLPTELLKDIAHNLEGTKKEDLLDPDTWKGLWYILNYSAATGAKGVLEEAGKRLSVIPGMDLIVQFAQSVIESPRDLLSLDTWKGAAVILGAAVQSSASSVKRRVLGDNEEA
jgi:hypothetical protein